MKVLICGDRNWTDEPPIRDMIHSFPQNTTIIQGGANGADTIAKNIAEKRGMEVITHTPKWEIYGRGAGPVRNKLMLTEGPDIVVAFHNNINASKGTKNMIHQARQKNIKVILVYRVYKKTVWEKK